MYVKFRVGDLREDWAGFCQIPGSTIKKNFSLWYISNILKHCNVSSYTHCPASKTLMFCHSYFVCSLSHFIWSISKHNLDHIKISSWDLGTQRQSELIPWSTWVWANDSESSEGIFKKHFFFKLELRLSWGWVRSLSP